VRGKGFPTQGKHLVVHPTLLAATYLQLPGTTADDLISAPATIDLGRRPIHNAGGGPCPGTTPDGRITLTQAIAVSCNTAFVALARDLGWPKIRDTAEKFGFTVGPTDVTAPAWLAQARLGVDSRVPENSDEAGLGNARREAIATTIITTTSGHIAASGRPCDCASPPAVAPIP